MGLSIGFSGWSNKLPEPQWLQTYLCVVLRLQSEEVLYESHWASRIRIKPDRASRGESIFLPFPASRGLWHPLAHGPSWLHHLSSCGKLSPSQRASLPPGFLRHSLPLALFCDPYLPSKASLGPQGSYLRISRLAIFNSPLSCNLTQSQGPGARTSHLWGAVILQVHCFRSQ